MSCGDDDGVAFRAETRCSSFMCFLLEHWLRARRRVFFRNRDRCASIRGMRRASGWSGRPRRVRRADTGRIAPDKSRSAAAPIMDRFDACRATLGPERGQRAAPRTSTAVLAPAPSAPIAKPSRSKAGLASVSAAGSAPKLRDELPDVRRSRFRAASSCRRRRGGRSRRRPRRAPPRVARPRGSRSGGLAGAARPPAEAAAAPPPTRAGGRLRARRHRPRHGVRSPPRAPRPPAARVRAPSAVSPAASPRGNARPAKVCHRDGPAALRVRRRC